MTHFNQILKEREIKVCLLDAAGVLYNGSEGILPETVKAIERMQKQDVLVGLLTNNSMQTPAHIQKWLASTGAYVPEGAIFTSGLSMVYDPRLNQQVKNKTVYVVGRNTSYSYFEQAGAKEISDNLGAADIVAIMSHNGPGEPNELAELAHRIKQKKIPVVCCNTDRFIRMDNRQFEVAGYFAQQLKTDYQIPIQWYGKPFRSFYQMIQRLLSDRFGVEYNQNVLYLDDLIANIRGSKQVGPITTAHVWGSGLDKKATGIQTCYCDYSIESFA